MESVSPPLDVQGLSKIFADSGDGIAGGIRDASFHLEPKTFFTLLGPSGCGKTTTLRCVAGLERPDSGTVRLGDEVFFDAARGISVPLNRRRLGMVFQSYAIWPHMTVFENVAFPLRVARDRRFDRAEIERMVGEALDIVSLNGFQTRPATRLSGGQQQRVALARAIVRQPKLLLLDEPLSNLDARLREDMRNELKRLQKHIGITTIYVTHDQSEALEMSDLIAVLNQGRVVQIGPPRDIYFRPRDAFVAKFAGSTNLLYGSVVAAAQPGSTGAVRLDDGTVLHCLFPESQTANGKIAVSVRPEAIALTGPDASTPGDNVNRMSGTVVLAGFLGHANRYNVQIGENVIQANTGPGTNFPVGANVTLEFPVADTVAVPL